LAVAQVPARHGSARDTLLRLANIG